MGPPPKRPAAASPEAPAGASASPRGRRRRTGEARSVALAGEGLLGAGAPSAALERRLFVAAQTARLRAYAPYSNFLVGAALLDDQGRIHAGCNVENAAYPQGVCAEAGALSAMVLAGGRSLRAVLVVGTGSAPCTPCGGCRQKLREFGADDLPVLVADPTGLRARFTLGELLPASFGPDHLKDTAA
jgi:cytidine deaminase